MGDIKNIKGIGTKTLSLLNKLNINSVDDLLIYYPYRYNVIKKNNLNDENAVVVCEVTSIPIINYFKKINRLSFKGIVDNKLINIIIFNRGYLKSNIKIGEKITLIGKYEENKNTFTCSNIKFIDIKDNVIIEPIYHLVKGLTNKSLIKYINSAINSYSVVDYIPENIREKYGFMDKKEAIIYLHFPKNDNIVKKAIIRSKYEELFLFMLKINFLRRKNIEYNYGYNKKIDEKKVEAFIEDLPFKLTNDQLKVIEEIKKDLSSKKRMNRLLQGDVGSGKTIVSIISMYIMKLNNYQSSLMAPTEILANQHYQNALEIFKNYDIKICLLTGSQTKKEKEEIKKQIEKGKIDIVIGTHAILQEDVKFNNLGLVITDEQHRFGVNQRNNLRNKGNLPDVLYMSATPIPRTYALTIYGDMDISIIKEVPKGRKKVITKIKQNKEIKDVLNMINNELELGHQIYIVSPLIENSDDDKQDIDKLYNKFKLAFKNYNIGILHGKMNNKEKDKVMNDYLNKKLDILISTTVIEVGVDVYNASMIVIFDAYQFGLSTLHQLRGRVGRNDFQSYCILVTNKEAKRLKIMEEVTDGFKLAEEDLKLRGYGDLFGIKQSGDMTFKIANLTKDYKILLNAKEDSDKILDNINDYKELKNILKKSINMD